VVAFFQTLPLLGNVLLFILFFMLLFSIIGVRAYQGSLQRRCVLPDGTASCTATILPTSWC